MRCWKVLRDRTRVKGKFRVGFRKYMWYSVFNTRILKVNAQCEMGNIGLEGLNFLNIEVIGGTLEFNSVFPDWSWLGFV